MVRNNRKEKIQIALPKALFGRMEFMPHEAKMLQTNNQRGKSATTTLSIETVAVGEPMPRITEMKPSTSNIRMKKTIVVLITFFLEALHKARINATVFGLKNDCSILFLIIFH